MKITIITCLMGFCFSIGAQSSSSAVLLNNGSRLFSCLSPKTYSNFCNYQWRTRPCLRGFIGGVGCMSVLWSCFGLYKKYYKYTKKDDKYQNHNKHETCYEIPRKNIEKKDWVPTAILKEEQKNNFKNFDQAERELIQRYEFMKQGNNPGDNQAYYKELEFALAQLYYARWKSEYKKEGDKEKLDKSLRIMLYETDMFYLLCKPMFDDIQFDWSSVDLSKIKIGDNIIQWARHNKDKLEPAIELIKNRLKLEKPNCSRLEIANLFRRLYYEQYCFTEDKQWLTKKLDIDLV